jgi:hypothetical protein
MRPHPDPLYGSLLFQNLIYEAVLDIDPTGISAGEVSHQFFEGWRGLKRILG